MKRITKNVFIMLALCMIAGLLPWTAMSVRAATVAPIDGITYTLDAEAYTALVAGLADGNTATELTIPETVMNESKTYNVTGIAERAFDGKTAITSVIIPASVTSVGTGAFTNMGSGNSIVYYYGGNTYSNISSWGINSAKPYRLLTVAATITNGRITASGTNTPNDLAKNNYFLPEDTVTLTLAPESDYSIGAVTYNDGSDHTITPVNGSYTFTMPQTSVTASAVFRKSLSHVGITVDPIADQTYAGSAITPEPTVKDGEKTLKKDTDYTLSYSSNINAAQSTATNAPTITITGKGSYSGTRTVKFTINKKFVTVGGIKAKNREYNGTTTATLDCSAATFAGKVDGDNLTVSGNGTFENKNAGKAKTVTISGLTLGGESKDNYVLAGNGYQTTATIFRATPEVTAPTPQASYGENLSIVTLNNPTGNLPGKWTWATDNGINPNETSVGTIGTHVFRAKFTPDDTANYCETTMDVTVTVGKATPNLTIADCSATYGHPVSAKSSCNSDGEVTYVFYKNGGKTKTDTEDGAETEGGPPKNAGTYYIAASVAETSNYSSDTQTLPNGCIITPAPNPAVLRSPVTVKRGSDYDLSRLVSGAKGTVSFELNGSPAGYSLSGSTLTLAGNADSSCTITVTADGTVDGKSNYETFSGEITVNATDLLPQDSFGFADVAQEKTYGDGDFIVAATGAETGSSVTYSSSAPTVATVEADTGKVHILKVGVATITAIAGETDTYASATASYKLTVNQKSVTIRGITADDMDYNPATALQGMTLNTGGAVIHGMVYGDELTVSATGICGDADVGVNKTVKIRTITLDGRSAGNYTVDIENSQQTTTVNISKADIRNTDFTAPIEKNDLKYTGLAQSLVDAGTAQKGEMRYALGTNTTAPADKDYSKSIPAAVGAGTYYVWYKAVGGMNYNDSTPGRVEVTIESSSEPLTSLTTGCVRVQTGTGRAASVNLKMYAGEEISIKDNGIKTTEPLKITNIRMAGTTLNFETDSSNGNEGSIELTIQSKNYSECKLTIPVIASDKTAEVKLDTGSGQTAVEGVKVRGLNDYADSQTGNTVNVVMNVITGIVPSDQTVQNNIENKIALVFSGAGSGEAEKEYLDISITESVNGGSAVPVHDVGQVLEIAIKYDLSGKYHPIVIREHNGQVTALADLNAKPNEYYPDGTFDVDEAKGIIYIYSRYFSTYSIAYATVNNAKITTRPVAVENLVYDGTEHALIKAGTATGGEMRYAVGVSDKSAPTIEWNVAIPKATGAGTYYVWYKVVGDDQHNDTEPVCLSVKIDRAKTVPATVTASDCTYDGTPHPLVTVTGEAVGGTMYYAVTTENKAPTDASLYTTSIPTATDAGIYYVWYKVVGDDNDNYIDSDPVCIPVTIRNYAFSDNGDVSYIKESNTGMNFTVDRTPQDELTFGLFKSASVDGRILTENEAVFEQGSLKIKLLSSYLDTVSEGQHILHVDFEDGMVETSFMVYARDNPDGTYIPLVVTVEGDGVPVPYRNGEDVSAHRRVIRLGNGKYMIYVDPNLYGQYYFLVHPGKDCWVEYQNVDKTVKDRGLNEGRIIIHIIPPTGDRSNILLWIVFTVFGGFGIAVLIRKKAQP